MSPVFVDRLGLFRYVGCWYDERGALRQHRRPTHWWAMRSARHAYERTFCA